MNTVEGASSRFGALATVLNQVLAPSWKMFTPPYILLLIRTFLTLEGIAARVDPEFNIYEMVRCRPGPPFEEAPPELITTIAYDQTYVKAAGRTGISSYSALQTVDAKQAVFRQGLFTRSLFVFPS